jgi:S1-C subfamily serine protease
MRRPLLAIPLVTLLWLPVLAAPLPWERITARVHPSMGRITITRLPTDDQALVTGDCSTFAIDGVRHYYLTAAHCQGDVLEVDGKSAGVVLVDATLDLLVLRVPEGRHPALASGHPVRQGQAVMAYGYAFGWTTIFAKTGVVAVPDLRIPLFGNRSLTLTDFAFIEGMSGGPVVDAEGRVVSMVQSSHSNGLAGQGPSIQAILGATGAFWGR